MHEAGLAASVADAMRAHALDRDGPPVRLVVHGGHTTNEAFDAALRLHLLLCLPELDPARLAIIHAPREVTCASCGRSFTAISGEEACASCGGPGIAGPSVESIELEWDEAARLPCA
jgi:Zn finger protein HypA/HybF involved in hydrogenase expression